MALHTSEIYTLSLHDALPISHVVRERAVEVAAELLVGEALRNRLEVVYELESIRSEEHTSELQSRPHLVCRLLLEKKKKKITSATGGNNFDLTRNHYPSSTFP